MQNRLDIILETVDQLLESRRKRERKLAKLLAGPRTPSTVLSSADQRAREASLRGRETIPSPIRGSIEAIAYLKGIDTKKHKTGYRREKMPLNQWLAMRGSDPTEIEDFPDYENRRSREMWNKYTPKN